VRDGELLAEAEEDEGEVEEDDPEGGEEARAKEGGVRRDELSREPHYLKKRVIPSGLNMYNEKGKKFK
jgi:hypothetical protein